MTKKFRDHKEVANGLDKISIRISGMEEYVAKQNIEGYSRLSKVVVRFSSQNV